MDAATESPFVLNLAPTGMVPTRAMNPHAPLAPEEVVAEVLDLVPLGVNMVHLHARDPATGAPAWQPEIYARMIGPIRAAFPDLPVCVSTSGRVFGDLARRSAVLDLDGPLRPDFASLTLGSLNFAREASPNAPDTVRALADAMRERGIRPELEVFDTGMANYARYLARKGALAPPFYFNLLLGNVATAQADPLTLGLLLRDLPGGSVWAGGGLGDRQAAVHAMALAAGGGVRVGLEDNLWLDAARARPATNRALVERALALAAALGRRPFTRPEARAALGLAPVAAP